MATLFLRVFYYAKEIIATFIFPIIVIGQKAIEFIHSTIVFLII